MSVSGAGPSSSGPLALGALLYLGNDAPTPVALAFRFYLCSVSTSQLLPAPLSMVRNRDPLGQSPGEGIPVDSPALLPLRRAWLPIPALPVSRDVQWRRRSWQFWGRGSLGRGEPRVGELWGGRGRPLLLCSPTLGGDLIIKDPKNPFKGLRHTPCPPAPGE